MPLARYCPNCDERLKLREPRWYWCGPCHIAWNVRHAYALPTAPLGDDERRESWNRARIAAGLP